MKTIPRSLSALAVAAGLTIAAPQVQAQTAARVESQTRPNFGLLLQPPVRSRSRPQHRRWNYRDHRPDWRPDWRPDHGPLPGGEEIVLVDCGGNPGTGAVEDAVRRVRPGGTLIIRANGRPCVGWLNIEKPLTIIGESGFDPRDWIRNTALTLQAPDGYPCVSVAPAVRVEIRDVVFASPRGGNAPCVVGDRAEILLNRVGFSHAGDEPAILVEGGLLHVRNTRIDAHTVSAAIIADGAILTTDVVTVTGARAGIEVIPGPGDSSISRTDLIGGDQLGSYGPRSIGLTVGSARTTGPLRVINSKICGYVEGVAIEGATVTIEHSRICKADKGVVLYNGQLTLTESRIRAETFGVAAVSGSAEIRNNVFARAQEAVYDRERASVVQSGNRIWSRSSQCYPSLYWRYRDRYEMSWGQRPIQGSECQATPYPQQWWAEEEGSLNETYVNDGYTIEGYDRFRQGRGWYDCDGRYVDSTRWYGDERWRRGDWGDNRDCRRRRSDRDGGLVTGAAAATTVGPNGPRP